MNAEADKCRNRHWRALRQPLFINSQRQKATQKIEMGTPSGAANDLGQSSAQSVVRASFVKNARTSNRLSAETGSPRHSMRPLVQRVKHWSELSGDSKLMGR
jgi:hypothetical protein